MKKKFTIHEVSRKEISPGKGSMIWLLSDEKGIPRKVNAIADLDKDGVVNAIHAVYSRETPLVEALIYHFAGDELEIDFSAFNAKNRYEPRQPLRQYKEHSLIRQMRYVKVVLWGLIFFMVAAFLYVISLDFNGLWNMASLKHY